MPQADGFLNRDDLTALFSLLQRQGYRIVGPTLSQGAIVYDELDSPADLPRGWTDEQGPGVYRLQRRDDDAYFGYVVGPHSWKKYLFPPQALVATAERTADGWALQSHRGDDDVPRYAFLGVRACEIAAIRVQDHVFTAGPYTDPIYAARREAALIIAVNCTQAAATCFCTSMNTGPECRSGFDLALTELADGFEITAGSATGRSLLAELPLQPLNDDRRERARAARDTARQQIQRELNTEGIRDLLLNNLNHPQWTDVAERCLSCTNCTMVCPTCFCSSVHEVSDLTGDSVRRERRWDSCFNPALSYIHGGIVRDSIRSRYRQWLTHKLASWLDQFGESGCVGCGRCITWCPTGIDLTAEVAAIRERDGRAVLADVLSEDSTTEHPA